MLAPAFQLQARGGTVEFDLFLETVFGEVWIFRREARVQRPWEEIVTAGTGGVPVVRPEVQLLYMAKSDEPKNEHDFEVVLATLDASSREWLTRALATVDATHGWLERLRSAG